MIVPTSFNLNPNIPGHNKRLRRVFRGAIGALDGTLIHAVVPTKEHDLNRGRGKRVYYQNVFAIFDFNMIFTFIVAGWEGVAHDSRILLEALSDPHAPFPFPPPEKYYLCDATYAHTRGFMAPYRNVRKEGLSDELFEQYDKPDVSFRNTHVHVADEDEVEAHSTASDREYMTQLRDEIAEQLMQSTE
ncbi:uncharacterized protein LOC143547359 [Bidens hawaiensis]|uniref:uncharacterized protein LOC143547359 n=1 Tax=Bidens hawaiensis TaxID=980011 RepID=UPI004049D81E